MAAISPVPVDFNDQHPAPHTSDNKGTHVVEKPTAPTEAAAAEMSKPAGVRWMEVVNEPMTKRTRIVLFLATFLAGTAFTLDGLTRGVYQAYATSSFANHSLLATVNVVRGAVAIASQPFAASLADNLGRIQTLLLALAFLVVGTAVEAFADNVLVFTVGAFFYQIGIVCGPLLVQIIIGDVTSQRSRVFFAHIPSIPFVFTTWVSGNTAAAFLAAASWRWGIGMWCFAYPVCIAPLILTLWLSSRKSQSKGPLAVSSISQATRRLVISLTSAFTKSDPLGVFLLALAIALILVPLTLAGGTASLWQSASVLAPLIIGALLIPAFLIWESRVKYPIIPFPLLRKRGVWAPMCVAATISLTWALQGNFLYTVLVVSFNFDAVAATRISSLYQFCGMIIGLCVGLTVMKLRRIRPVVLAGSALWLVSFGLLLRFRSGTNQSARMGVIAAEVILGVAGGFFPYTLMTALQVQAAHEYLAMLTSVIFVVNNVAASIGICISGAIWRNILPGELRSNLGDQLLASTVFASPFEAILNYGVESPERKAIIDSYSHIQFFLVLAGLVISVLVVAFTLMMKDPPLLKAQSSENEEA